MSKFPGFPPESQTWNFPTIVNGYVHILNGAEFKILFYILRHTYGFQKTEDAISYKQFKEGIQKKDDTWLDRGTGLSTQAIKQAISGLLNKGFIEAEKRRYKGRQGITVYRPRFQKVESDENPIKSAKEDEATLLGTDLKDSTRFQKSKSDSTKNQNQKQNSENTSIPIPASDCGKTQILKSRKTIRQSLIRQYTQQAEAIYSEYPKKADRNNSIKSIIKLLEKPPKELQPDPISILKKCISNYKAYIEQEGKKRRYVIQSNNFFGEAERYKEFLHYERPKSWDQED